MNDTVLGGLVVAAHLTARAPMNMVWNTANYLGYLPANVGAVVESALADPAPPLPARIGCAAAHALVLAAIDRDAGTGDPLRARAPRRHVPQLRRHRRIVPPKRWPGFLDHRCGEWRNGMRQPIPCCLALCLLALAMPPALAQVPGPAAIEALLNRTADQLTAEAPEGKGYSYYTYGSKELRYAIGDLDGDGKPEIAARSVYFLGAGSYDLVDIFSDRGNGYERVDFINLYNVDLYDQVASVEIGDGLLTIHTTGQDRGQARRKSGTFRWQGPDKISPATRPPTRSTSTCRRSRTASTSRPSPGP